MPAMSRCFASGSRDSRTPVTASAIVTIAMNAWIRNTHCQPETATIVAPMIGPKPSPMPKMMPQAAKARGALAALLELMGEHRDLADQHRATAHALKEAADDEQERVLRQAADQRSEAEHGDADHEHALSP